MGIVLKKAKTMPIEIPVQIDTDQGRIEGKFIGHAHIMSRSKYQDLVDDILERFAKGEVTDADAELARKTFDSFEGIETADGTKLTGEAAFAEVLDGDYSSVLTPAAVFAHKQKLGVAAQGNFKPSRKR